MKNIGFKITMCVMFLCFGQSLFSQINRNLDYEKHAAEVRKEVWSWNMPEFERRDVPDEYSDASSVILAFHNDVVAKSRQKIRFSMITILTTNNELYYVNTTRQLVKINDQAALDEYSEMSIQQMRKRSGRAISNTMLTIAGVRIIKPDGSIQEVDMSEAVMTRDEKRDKQSKIAISGLQVGDLIDFFIRVEEQMDDKDIDPLLFVFGSDVPVLSYSVHCEIGNRFTVEYRAMNGAPDFTQTTNADNDFILDARMQNIAGMPIELWMSPIRQIPVLRMHILDNNHPGTQKSSRKPGTIHPNINPDIIIDETSEYIGRIACRFNAPVMLPHYREIKKLVTEYKKTHSSDSDSIAQLVYYALRHYSFNQLGKNIITDNRRNYQTASNFLFSVALERMLKQFKIPCKFIYLPSSYGPSLNQVLSVGDVVLAVSTMSENPVVMCAEGLFTTACYIPPEYTGQQLPVISIKKINARTCAAQTVKEKPFDIAAKDASANRQYENLIVQLNPENPDELLLSRNVTLKGSLKQGRQELLLLFEQYESEERKALGIKTTMLDDLRDGKDSKNILSEYINAFQDARQKQEEWFGLEIEAQYEVKAKKITDYAVLQNGIIHQHPDMIYRVGYLMDGWVKKAGSDYLVDVGKFIGTQLVLKPKERNRTADIYMPSARSFGYDIQMDIPEGYIAEGIENLNMEVRNQCGEFIVVARQENNKVLFSINKAYFHEFEPVANWPSLLEMIDAANQWSSKTIMLRKL